MLIAKETTMLIIKSDTRFSKPRVGLHELAYEKYECWQYRLTEAIETICSKTTIKRCIFILHSTHIESKIL